MRKPGKFALSGVLPAIAAILIAAALVGAAASPHKGLATLSFGLLSLGLFQRKVRSTHATLMVAGIVLDLALVVLLQISRDAIHTAVGPTLNDLQRIHVGASTAATFLYLPVLFLGAANLFQRGGSVVRRWHVRLAIPAYAFRAIGFIFMFFVPGGHVTH